MVSKNIVRQSTYRLWVPPKLSTMSACHESRVSGTNATSRWPPYVNRASTDFTATLRWHSESSDGSQLARSRKSLRLMPLGGSITYGQGSSDGNGYRNTLHQMLLRDGHMVEFVGSRKAGCMVNNENEGWRGFRIDQILEKARKSVPTCVPDIFTVNAGSNDCLQKFGIDCVRERMDRLLEYLWTTCPWSTIILSTLVVSADEGTEALVLGVNEQFRNLAEQKSNEQKRIVFVDMHAVDGPARADLVDGTHPNDVGYFRMARIWHSGILEAVSKKYIQEPPLKSDDNPLYL